GASCSAAASAGAPFSGSSAGAAFSGSSASSGPSVSSAVSEAASGAAPSGVSSGPSPPASGAGGSASEAVSAPGGSGAGRSGRSDSSASGSPPYSAGASAGASAVRGAASGESRAVGSGSSSGSGSGSGSGGSAPTVPAAPWAGEAWGAAGTGSAVPGSADSSSSARPAGPESGRSGGASPVSRGAGTRWSAGASGGVATRTGASTDAGDGSADGTDPLGPSAPGTAAGTWPAASTDAFPKPSVRAVMPAGALRASAPIPPPVPEGSSSALRLRTASATSSTALAQPRPMAMYTRLTSASTTAITMRSSAAARAARLHRINTGREGLTYTGNPNAARALAALVRGLTRVETAVRGRLGLLLGERVGARTARGAVLHGRSTAGGRGHRLEPAGGVQVRRRGRLVAALGELAELALEVVLQAGAVLALEVLEDLDLVLQLLALLHEGAHHLAVALLGVPVQVLRAGAGLVDDLLGLAAGLAEDVVGLVPGAAQGLVGLAAGVGDGLVGGLLGEGQDPRGGVHVLLGTGQAHVGGHRRHRLLDLRRGRRRSGLGLRRLGLHLLLRLLGLLHAGVGHLAAEAFGELAAQLLVLLDQPVQLGLDLVEEGVDLFFVIARS